MTDRQRWRRLGIRPGKSAPPKRTPKRPKPSPFKRRNMTRTRDPETGRITWTRPEKA